MAGTSDFSYLRKNKNRYDSLQENKDLTGREMLTSSVGGRDVHCMLSSTERSHCKGGIPDVPRANP